MKRINPEEKVCASCRFSLPLVSYYEGKTVCKVCARAKQLKQLGRQLHVQPYLDNWRRYDD